MVRWPNSARVLLNIEAWDNKKRRPSTGRASKPRTPAHLAALKRKMSAEASDVRTLMKALLSDPSAEGLAQIEAAKAALLPPITALLQAERISSSPVQDPDADIDIPF